MEQYASLIVSFVAIVGSACTAFYFYRNNVSQVSSDVINTYKERIQQLQKEMDTLRTEIHSLTAQVNELTGVVKAKDDRIATLEATLSNRNPELEKSLTALTQIADMSKIYMSESAVILGKIMIILEDLRKRLPPPDGLPL